jgi:membrane-associated protease RseP (regulator of RpoE activity)
MRSNEGVTMKKSSEGTSLVEQAPQLGLNVVPMTPELRAFFGGPRNAGLLVSRVIPWSTAATAGLRVGDVIVRVGDRDLAKASELRESISVMHKGSRTTVSIIRRHEPRELTLEIRSTASELAASPAIANVVSDVVDRIRRGANIMDSSAPPRKKARSQELEQRIRQLESRVREIEGKGPVGV